MVPKFSRLSVQNLARSSTENFKVEGVEMFSYSLSSLASYGMFAILLFANCDVAASGPLNERAPQIPSSAPVLIQDIHPAQQKIYAVGERGIFLKSNDHGESWQQVRLPVRSNLVALTDRGEELWAVGHEGVVIRVQPDEGASKLITDGEAINRLQESYYENLVEEIRSGKEPIPNGYSLEDLEYLLTDSRAFSEEGASRPLFDIEFVSRKKGYAVGAFGLLLETEDGGETWLIKNAVLENAFAFHLNAIESSQETLVIPSEQGILFLSEDAGASWRRLQSPYDGTLFGARFTSPTELYVFGLRGTLMRLNLKSNEWAVVDTDTQRSIFTLAQRREGDIAIGGNGALLKFAVGDAKVSAKELYRNSVVSDLEFVSGKLLAGGSFGLKKMDVSHD